MSMQIYIVYKYTAPNGKIYIGKTSLLRENTRKKQHIYDAENKRFPGMIFHRAINKYGFDNFKYEVLAYTATDDTAKLMEIALIKQFKSNDRKYGYNLTNGGDGMFGYKHSEESKRKIGDRHKGSKKSKEAIEKMRRAKVGMFKGSDNPRHRPVEYWSKNVCSQPQFKGWCKRNNYKFEDFDKIWEGERNEKQKLKLYYFRLKGDDTI
ncbi:MAG: GIY-YIG nuclease family protein [Paraclostridium sp.]